MKERPKKILFSVGGTGGHLFPAQAAASELTGCEILFVGSGLSKNPFFDSKSFAFQDISAAPIRFSLSTLRILKGIVTSLRILKRFSPDLIVAFGSFHTFPVLAAAWIRRIPFLLHEQNKLPGKVNRLFSRSAKISVITFPETASYLSGPKIQALYPLRKKHPEASPYAYFGLKDLHSCEANGHKSFAAQESARDGLPDEEVEKPKMMTLLVYGGSQGAIALNTLFLATLPFLKKRLPPFQVIHFAGRKDNIKTIQAEYASYSICACVKDFETHPDIALQIVDLAITRAGAGTIAELIDYEVPAIIIPYPHATDNHQQMNGQFFANEVKGGWLFTQDDLKIEDLAQTIEKAALGEISVKKSQIMLYKQKQTPLNTLSQIILAQSI